MSKRLLNVSAGTLRDTLRRGLQSAIAATATFAAMQVLGLEEEYIAILGAVLILQPSVGGTMGAALSRLQATLVGSLLGLACIFLLPDRWGTSAALALSMMVVGGFAGLRSDWTYGAVAAVGIALAPADAPLATAWSRGLGLLVGAGVGVLVSLLVWPDRAEARFERHLRAALRATATRLSDAIDAAMTTGREAAPPDHVAAYHKALGLAQEALEATKLVERAGMQRRLEALRRLYNSVIILDRAAESGEPPLAGSEEPSRLVGALREDACNILTGLAESRGEPDRQTRGIDEELARLRAALAQDDPSSESHLSRDAVAFGLREVRRTLADLLEAWKGAG